MTFPQNLRIEPMPCTLCAKVRPLDSPGCGRDQCPIRAEWVKGRQPGSLT